LRRAWGVSILGLISLIAAVVTGRDLYYYLSYLLLGLLVLSGLWAWLAMRGLRLSRYTRSRHAQVGRPLEEYFSLKNTTWLPKLWVVIRDQSDLPGHHASRVIHGVGPRREHGWTVRTLCERRGRFRLGPVVIASSDPLGLFEFRTRLPQTTSIVVYPATVPMYGFPMPLSQMPGGDALRRRVHHVTTSAAGVRDYVPGDGFNRIHWPSTARKDQLIVKEFELDPLLDVWVFLDMQRSVHFEEAVDEAELLARERAPLWVKMDQWRLVPSTEEYAVTAAASVAEFFIRRKRSVGLVAYGQRRELIQADRGERQLGKILETLAALRAEGEMPFSEVLSLEARRLTRGSTVVAVSPAILRGWVDVALFLDRSGFSVVTLLVDPAGFGGEPGARMFRERLLAARMPTILLRKGESLSEQLGALRQQRSLPVLASAHAGP
jgi:uncharacterized protein (DUF58 family)